MSQQKSLLVYAHEAAEVLGVSRAQFYEFAKHLTFPKARRPGKRVMYVREELEKWVKELEIE